MTLERKRWLSLSWNFPFNHRKVKEGEEITHRVWVSEGIYRWSIKSLPGEVVETVHTQPYTFDLQGNIYSSEPSIRKTKVFAEEINGFGPENIPWRWTEK